MRSITCMLWYRPCSNDMRAINTTSGMKVKTNYDKTTIHKTLLYVKRILMVNGHFNGEVKRYCLKADWN